MIVTVLKTTFQRLPPKIRNYRYYSNFDHGMFRTCLFNDLSKEDVGNLEKFIKVCINTLNNYAPSKKKYTRGNHLPFMNKELSKAIMNLPKLLKRMPTYLQTLFILRLMPLSIMVIFHHF